MPPRRAQAINSYKVMFLLVIILVKVMSLMKMLELKLFVRELFFFLDAFVLDFLCLKIKIYAINSKTGGVS